MPMSSLAAELGLRQALALAADQELVVGRRQLYQAGVPRWLVRRELRVRRWRRTGRQTVALHNGPLSAAARRWVAVIELGPRAALAGVSALQHDGLGALTDEEVHVIAPRGVERRKLPGVVLHESRRFREQEVVTAGIRRTLPAVSAVHGALWSVTARQASFVLTLAVQQGLCTPQALGEVAATVRRHRLRSAIIVTIADLSDGVRSLGELDVARAMRSRGLPEPSRQAVRKRPSGKQYLDAEFEEYSLVLEVDGEQHDLPWARLSDTVRDLGLMAEGREVMRIPLVAWRIDQERVLDALEAVFRSRGWLPSAA
jgi:very-short-patch-repair endonuclease